MSIQKLIQESIAGNPLEMKEALVEELKSRISEALAAKMEEAKVDDPHKGSTPISGLAAARNGHRLGKTYNNPHHPKYHKDSHSRWDDEYKNETSRLKNKGAVKEEVELDESVSFKKTDSGDHHIHHNGKPVGRITKTSSMGSNGYSVRIGGNTAKHEVGTESSLAAAKDSAKWHLTSSESPVNMKEEVDTTNEGMFSNLKRKLQKAVDANDKISPFTGNLKTKPYDMKKSGPFAQYSDDDPIAAALKKQVNKNLKKEEVEQIDEIGDTPAGRKALKAVIARAPEKAANSRLRSDVLGRRQFDPDVSSADSERYGHAADKHYKKYQLAVKGAARAVDRLTKEEVELDEAEGRQIVDKLKSTGEHEEAGKMAFKHGLGRSYGPHFGMRSSKYSAETAYHKGYDKAEFASRK